MKTRCEKSGIITAFLTMALMVLFGILGCAEENNEAASHGTLESGFIEVDHGQLYYEITGTGETVVLIHGGFGDRRYWDHQIDALTTTHRVLRYDLRGFGKSSQPVDGVDFSDHADLAHLLGELNIPSAHIVGFSSGAAIATEFVLTYPERSKSLVSVGPWVRGYHSEAREADIRDFSILASVANEQGDAAATDYLLKEMTIFRETIRSPETEIRLRDMIKDYSWWEFKQEDPRLPLEPGAIDRLDDIVVPTLIVTAEYEIPTCSEVAELLKRTIPNSRKLVFADAGHFVMMEKPEAFNRALLDFFTEILKQE